jgi:hypothetical protein
MAVFRVPAVQITARVQGHTAGDYMMCLCCTAAAQVSPRANIFRRDQAGVTSLDGMKHLMRYNDYDHDKLSGHHPVASVCSRGDLAKTGAVPKGCYDTKVRVC